MRFSLSASLVGVVIVATFTSVVNSEDGKTAPDEVKPGSCPMTIQGCPDDHPPDKIECTNDTGCPDNLKCCPTPCWGAGCMLPDDIAPQPTYCPDYRAIRIACDGTRVMERCIDNKECSDGKICCRSPCGGTECFTGGTQAPEEKPGQCEVVNWAALSCAEMDEKARQVECTRDTDCEGAQKCCDNPCTNQRCRDPARNGTCPDYTGIKVKCPAVIPKDECSSDSQCKDPNQKCCNRMCGGKGCLDPQGEKSYDGKEKEIGDGDSNDRDGDDDYETVAPTKPGHCYMHTMGCPAGREPDPKECDNDFNCTDNLKCCSTSCFGMTCQKPQPSFCPDYRTMLVQNCDGERDTCIDDTSCTGGKLCCKSPCGGFECFDGVDSRPETKPGQCEYVPWELIDCAPMSEEARQTECTQDYDCDGELKCCENACTNKRCKPRVPEKNGTCPDYSNVKVMCPAVLPTDDCHQDNDCDGNQKCCTKICGGLGCQDTIETLSEKEKPGECEDYSNIQALCIEGSYENSTAECSDDQDCEGNRKCCPQLCIKPLCKAPLRPGICPATIQGCPSDQTPAPDTCDDDFNCDEEQKCCSSGCGGRACVTADHEVRAGECPADTEMACAPDTQKTDECQYDEDCLYGLKCCARNCLGKRCVEPDYDYQEPYPSFECPYYDPNRACFVPNKQECTLGNKCDDGSQCCQYECSGTRCEPVLCPTPNPGIRCVMMNPLACNASDECGDDSICCTYECGGRKCIKKDSVQTILPEQKPGQCVRLLMACMNTTNRPNDTCVTDQDCKDSDKCCEQPCGNLQCAPAYIVDPGPVEHPGQCPAGPVPSGTSGSAGSSPGSGPTDPAQCNVRCTNRTDCQAGELCCNDGFFGTQCQSTSQCPQVSAPAPGTKIPCSIRCTDDVDCGEGNMCCRASEGGTTCREKQYDPSGSPYCPMVMPPAPTSCPQTCDNDAPCAPNEKCCKNDCGGTQCYPVQDVVHPGQCPADPVPSGSSGSGSSSNPGSDANQCTIRCTNSSQCDAGLRCCHDGFYGTKCWNNGGIDQCPQLAAPAPGTIIPCTIHCTNDVDCGADSMCCQTSANKTECIKKGNSPSGKYSCPMVMPPPPSTCPNTCNSDASCASNEKCCKNDCGGTQCYAVKDEEPTPVPYPSFVCPYWDSNRACVRANEQECELGSLCDDGSQCCQYECSGTRCQRAMCPAPNPGIRCAKPNPQACNASDECGADSICCEYECSGRKCIKKEHPGTCPNTTGTIGTCAFSCQGDHNCPDTEKCCTNGCGGTNCMATVASPVCPVFDPKATCGDKRKPYSCDPTQKCSNGGKCCQYECQGTRCETDLCPAPDMSIQCIAQESRDCNKSTDCGDDKKCCEIYCGGTRCFPREEKQDDGKSSEGSTQPPKQTDPDHEVTAGVCPLDMEMICAPDGYTTQKTRKQDECQSNEDCSDGLICCGASCLGYSCVAPMPIHEEEKQDDGKSSEGSTQPPKQIDPAVSPGALVCPNHSSIKCTPALQKRSCSSDSQCGNKKCCDTGCNELKICQTPVRQGNCPVINVRCAQATSDDAPNQCGTDMGCPGNQKCCNHSCPGFGTRCYDPDI